ncbi:tetratricopeptide repeat protein [Lacinutrix sp. MEBiC02404]
MRKHLTFLILTIFVAFSYGQTANELNEQSKEFLLVQNFEKSYPLIKKSAELGNAEAQYNLGVSLEYGYGIEKNELKAFEWYLKSAEQAWNDGLYKMMMAHATGKNAEMNYDKAFEYALKCAENDDATCMLNVVSCYKDGMGTEKNLEKMLEWAIRLGKLQNPENLARSGKITSARLNLAYMYRDGTDVEKDLNKSYAWFLIFNEFKRDFSYLQQQSIVKEIEQIEKELSVSEKANGQKNAEIILGRSLVNMDNLYKAEM